MRTIKLLALYLSAALAVAPVDSRKADQFEPIRERIREKLVQQRVMNSAAEQIVGREWGERELQG
jgi:hypothetical protein